MAHTIRRLGGVSVIVAATLLWGCDGPTTSTLTAPGPIEKRPLEPPTGSTSGETLVNVLGSFHIGAVATFGGVSARVWAVSNSFMSVITPAHAAGAVDVVVTTVSGEVFVIPGGYTYENRPAPTITGISPNVGSTAGGDLLMRITGSGLQAAARITLGGVSLPGFLVNNTTIVPTVPIPAHAAGTVDVVVTNGDGQSSTLLNAFTYAPPESFDANGNWEGEFPEATPIVKFTIQNNLLISISCGASEVFTFIPPAVVSGGAFSASRADGVSVSGRIVAPSLANGTSHIPACPVEPWIANKK